MNSSLQFLEDFKTEILEQELKRRKENYAKGICPYCGHKLNSMPPCKNTSQHSGK